MNKITIHKAKGFSGPRFRIDMNIGAAIRKSIIKEISGCMWEARTGYTIYELIDRLKSTVTVNEWIKYMEVPTKFCMDHIIPKAVFTYSSYDDEEFKKCWALDNLQILSIVENSRKATKIDRDILLEYIKLELPYRKLSKKHSGFMVI